MKQFLVGVLFLMSLFPLTGQAATFWEEDFENHLTPNWDTSACGNSPQDGCNPRISTNIAHSGTHSLLADYTCLTQSSGYGCGTFYDRTFTASGEVWFRYYSYTVPTFQYWPTNMAKRFSLRPLAGYGNMWIAHWYGTRNEGYSLEYNPPTPVGSPCRTGDPECILGATSTAKPLLDGQWYCIEGHLKANTVGQSDGLYEMWVNTDTQVVSYPTRGDFSSTVQWSIFRLYVQNSIGTMYYDDIAVGNTRIGCNITGNPADSTPPPVPSAPTVAAQTLPLSVSWVGVTNPGDLAGYKYYRKEEICSGSTAMTLITTLGNVLTYTDTTIPNTSTNVCIKISSYDTSSNESSSSAGLDVTLTPPAASTRVTRFTETFNIANTTDIGAVWDGGYTGSYGFQVLSNQVAPNGLGGEAVETYNGYSLPADQWACKKINNVTANATDGVLLRFAAPPTLTGYYIKMRAGNPSVRIDKYTAGAWAIVASNNSATPAWVAGDSICGEVEGTTLRVYRVTGGVSSLVLTTTDTSFASGRVGMQAYATLSANEALGDDFTAGDFNTGTPTNDTFSTTTSITIDATGADLVFAGKAHKVRYWNELHPRGSEVEIVGLGGVGTYRIVHTWEVTPTAVTFVCAESQGSDGIWETASISTSYKCNKTPLATTDSTAPANPTGLGVR